MRKLLRRLFRPVGWALTVAFAVALSADCVASEEMTEAQKACCAAMGHDCGRMPQAQDCCSHQTPQIQKFSATKPITLVPPVVLNGPGAILPATFLVFRCSPSLELSIPSGQKLPGVSTYLANATFRV